MKKILTLIVVALLIVTSPIYTIHAQDTEPETPVEPIDPDDYVVRQLSGSGTKTLYFPNGYQIATVSSFGSGNVNSQGNIESFDLSTSAYISNGEGYSSANVQLISVNYVNNGTSITVNYTIKITVSTGASLTGNGSYVCN